MKKSNKKFIMIFGVVLMLSILGYTLYRLSLPATLISVGGGSLIIPDKESINYRINTAWVGSGTYAGTYRAEDYRTHITTKEMEKVNVILTAHRNYNAVNVVVHGEVTLKCNVQGQDYMLGIVSIDILNGETTATKTISKVVSNLPDNCYTLKLNSLVTQVNGGSQGAYLDISIQSIPFTYKKKIATEALSVAKSLTCVGNYLYCDYGVTECAKVKNSETNIEYNCEENKCEGFFATPITIQCILPTVVNAPKVEVFAHSYTPFCTNEACPLPSKQCSFSQPQVCVDTNDDNCGDEWQNVGNSCSGNYNCQSGDCICNPSITCSNGKVNNERWCENNGIKKCVVNQASCTANIVTETTCQSPQVCDLVNNQPQCKCVGTQTIGTKEQASLSNQYYEWISSTPCPIKQLKNCQTGRDFNGFSKTCDCKNSLTSCNEDYLHDNIECINANSREKCSQIIGSELNNQFCWNYQPFDVNTFTTTRTCEGSDYQCIQDTCFENQCSGDGAQIRLCQATSDLQCPILKDFTSCQPGYLCSLSTKKCEPQNQCNPQDPNNGLYLRCSPISNTEIQECKKDAFGVYNWIKVPTLACDVGKVCQQGSNAFCGEAYKVDITSLQDYAVQKPITDISMKLSSASLNPNNVVVVSCIESEKLGCTDETKYTPNGLQQIRTDASGKTPILTFSSAPKTGKWFISAYVKDYKESTLTSKEINIKNRLDLAVNAPITNFIGQDIVVTYRATDVDTAKILIPNVDITLDFNQVNIPFAPVGVDGFKFKVDKIGSAHYKVIGSLPTYMSDSEEGYIEITSPLIESEIKLDGTNINNLLQSRIDVGLKEITIIAKRNNENLRIDTSSLRMRNPSQIKGQGDVLLFTKDSNNVYTTKYNFQQTGTTYYLEGTFTILDLNEVIPIEQIINTKQATSGSGSGEDIFFSPLTIIGAVVILLIAIGTTIWIAKKARRR